LRSLWRAERSKLRRNGAIVAGMRSEEIQKHVAYIAKPGANVWFLIHCRYLLQQRKQCVHAAYESITESAVILREFFSCWRNVFSNFESCAFANHGRFALRCGKRTCLRCRCVGLLGIPRASAAARFVSVASVALAPTRTRGPGSAARAAGSRF